MFRKYLLLSFLTCLVCTDSRAQAAKESIRKDIHTLASPAFSGRGYVDSGSIRAARFLAARYRQLGLHPFTTDSSFLQAYTFDVQTFPGKIGLKIGRKKLRPGKDFIIHESSTSLSAKRRKLITADLATIRDSASWLSWRNALQPDKAYFLRNWDSLTTRLNLNRRTLKGLLPPGLFIIPRHGKLTWSVGLDDIGTSIFYVEDTVLPRRMRTVKARLDARFQPQMPNHNVIGYIPGTAQPDTFIVFSAHFDHLGKMGRKTIFPGAHDNASGTSLLLHLAAYYATHPQRYSIAFMAFSGEEAGLLGSKYYTAHPLFPLGNVRMVFNMDMTGEARNGITVVNARQQQAVFQQMQQINEQSRLLSKINERDQTRNSDHYPFSEKGVPAIFIYGNGTKPFYHDVFDQAHEITLDYIDNLALLLIQTVSQFR